MQMLGVDSHRSSFHSFFRFFDEIFVKNDDVLSFVILDEIHVLQRRDDVFFLDRRHFANFIDRYRRSINRLESQKLGLVDARRSSTLVKENSEANSINWYHTPNLDMEWGSMEWGSVFSK